MTETQTPDTIAHLLVTNVDELVRIHLEDGQLTIPTEPCRGGTPATTTVSVDYFDAIVERAAIEDGGLTLCCMDGLHLPASEWVRTGLDRHWHADDADLRSPFFPPRRMLEVWASREDSLHASDAPYIFSHLDEIPSDSPVITEWASNAPDRYPDRPPVPFDRPTLSVRAIRAEGVTDVRGFDRIEVGQISRVEPLESIAEQPTAPDIELREVDLSPPARHPEITYKDLDPLPHSDELLGAVFTINRHAKRLGAEADTAYRRGDGAHARAHAVRKRALYRTKTVAVHRFGRFDPDSIRVARHTLGDGHELLCFYIENYSYHQPPAAVEPDFLEAIAGVDDRSELPAKEINLESSTETATLDRSLSAAISILRDHGIEPNEYLDQRSVEDFTDGFEIATTF
ncbi:hypothetical protein [Halalkalirubrum salinum]|uniref:hypothetical protein n=1 Tax=Halalkalirubrum salinum TaxID=2563889 RepID=UPI0010FB8068|nr:hypothetical protein [Halalkalirubrum salinum]